MTGITQTVLGNFIKYSSFSSNANQKNNFAMTFNYF